jgi:sugar/nucleoside kinase (ribokinase family)
VLSDPLFDNGHGERTFVNTIGASWHYLPEEIDESFYDSDICVFGGTAIVPRIHQGLSTMLCQAKQHGCITVVNTVYDFLNQKQHPEQRWPMGDGDESYRYIDLLIVDHEEALRLSGCCEISSSIAFFREKGTGAVLVTNGAKNVSLWADSPLFGSIPEQTMPVSAAVGEALKQGRKGDSTGCGDNFAGGVIGSLARQMANRQIVNRKSSNSKCFDLREATRWGIVSGGFACFYYGGTYLEQKEGEKLSCLQDLYDQYIKQ